MADRRYCVILSTVYGDSKQEPAWFFQLGPSTTLDEGNHPIPITSAYVERIRDGRLLEVDPSTIQFVEKPIHGDIL